MRFFSSWQTLALAAGAALLLFLAYGSVLTRGPFGINDDYQYLYRVHAGTFDPAHNEQTGMGRPVTSWTYEAMYFLCDGKVARLVWLRALSLVGIGLFAWTLFRTLLTLDYGAAFAATVAALVALSPAFGVYAAWAAALPLPLALLAALVAGRWLDEPGGWPRKLAGVFLLAVACAVWQAAAPMALFPTLARTWRRTADPAPPPRATRWWEPWLWSGVAVVLYVLGCGLINHFGHVGQVATQRFALGTSFVGKARLLAHLSRIGFTSWARLQTTAWEWTVGAVTVAACLAALGGVRTVVRRAGLAAALLLLSVAPLLAAREDNAAFRSLPVLYTVVVFLGVDGLHRLLRGRLAAARGACSLLLVLASVGAARYHVWHGLVEPNVREYTGVRDQIRRQFPAGAPARLVYLLPPYTLLGEQWMTTSWEYGLVSSTFWWVTRPFLLLAFADASPDGKEPTDLTISYREVGNPPGTPVLDPLPALLREPGVWHDDPLWGRVREHRRGWRYSPWFGYFSVGNFPYVQHHLLGTLIYTAQPKDGKDLWFYHEGVGQFLTRADTYPRLFVGASNRWMLLSDDHPAHAVLTDPDTGTHLPYPP